MHLLHLHEFEFGFGLLLPGHLLNLGDICNGFLDEFVGMYLFEKIFMTMRAFLWVSIIASVR